MEQNSDIKKGEAVLITDIFSKPPNWFVLWGSSIVFIIILLLFILSWFLKYPDKINGEVQVFSRSKGVEVIANTSGFIESFTIENKHVDKHQILGVIDSPINYLDVKTLNNFINEIKNYDLGGIDRNFSSQKVLSLGSIQPYFDKLIGKLEEIDRLNSSKNWLEERKKFLYQKNNLQNRNLVLKNIYKISKNELELTENNFKRDSLLYENDHISYEHFSLSQITFLKQLQTVENNLSSILNNEFLLSEIEYQLNVGETRDNNQRLVLEHELNETINLVEKEIEEWSRNYLIKAPISGQVNYLSYIGEYSFIEKGETVLIINSQERSLIGTSLLPAYNIGKVKLGSKVYVKLQNYPSTEFGQIEAEISSLSETPDKSGLYYIELDFPNFLETSYGIEIPQTGEMRGEIEIITNEKRLMERIFYNFRELLS